MPASAADSDRIKTIKDIAHESGGLGGYGLLWLLGIPLPILLIIFLIRG